MAMLGSKWALLVLIPISVLVILFVLGKKSVQAEVKIEATPDQVWTTLTDVARVKEWNTVLIPKEGSLQIGNTIKYAFYQEEGGKPAEMNAKVRQLTPNALINQAGGMPGILTFDHKYILTQEEEYTLVRIQEEYRGIMVNFWNPEPVERAYERLLGLLKKRIEEE